MATSHRTPARGGEGVASTAGALERRDTGEEAEHTRDDLRSPLQRLTLSFLGRACRSGEPERAIRECREGGGACGSRGGVAAPVPCFCTAGAAADCTRGICAAAWPRRKPTPRLKIQVQRARGRRRRALCAHHAHDSARMEGPPSHSSTWSVVSSSSSSCRCSLRS